MSHKKYDIIIIGAGPAGLLAGRTLLKNSCTNVLLLDKTAPWEHTVPCAEGVGKLGFIEAASPLSPSWIRHQITSATFHAPGGESVHYLDANGGYIIDRARMQCDIAEEIAAKGIKCQFHQKVTSVSQEKEGVRTVTTQTGEMFTGRIIIDASGPITRFGNNEAIQVQHMDLEPAYFAWVDDLTIHSDRIHIFAGQSIAPGGYAWLFPRGEGGANIGIVLGKVRPHHTNIRHLLDTFIARNYPDAHIVKRFAGPIPCGHKRALPMAIPGFIKAGDAASTVNPISRAGISEALLCGELAAEAACSMLDATTKKGALAAAKYFEREWNQRRGNRHQKLAKAKVSLRAIPDSDYDNGAEALAAIPQNEMTMSKIFRASLSRFPRLVWALRHLM